MESVLVLIAPSQDMPLGEGIVAAVADLLNDEGGEPAPPRWLAPGLAAEIPFAGIARAAAEASVRRMPGAAGLEIAALAASSARFSPEPVPMPIRADPVSLIMVRTSAKSTFINPGTVINSEIH